MCMNTYMFISPVLYYKGVPPYVVVPCNRNCLLGFGYVNILNWRFEFGLPQKINCARHHFLLGLKQRNYV